MTNGSATWVVGSVYKSRVVGVDVGVDVADISMFDIYLIIRYLATPSITGNITFQIPQCKVQKVES